MYINISNVYYNTMILYHSVGSWPGSWRSRRDSNAPPGPAPGKSMGFSATGPSKMVHKMVHILKNGGYMVDISRYN